MSDTRTTSVLLSNKQCVQNNTLCTLIVFVSALFPLNGCQEIKIKTFQCLQLLSTFKPLRYFPIPPMGSIILVNRETCTHPSFRTIQYTKHLTLVTQEDERKILRATQFCFKQYISLRVKKSHTNCLFISDDR